MNPVWIILFAPLIAAALITVLTRKSMALSALLSCGAILTGFVLTLQLYFQMGHGGGEHLAPAAIQWLSISNTIKIEIGGVIDHQSILMLLVVTGVGSAIHIYSLAYMKGDPGFSRFFACLSLFTFSMLGIVLANNFIQIFIFWELVGVSSYLLIGYYFEKPSAVEAGKKAFLVNRIGDFGMMLGILLLFSYTKTFDFATLKAGLASYNIPACSMTLIGLLIFCGAMGKSAQFPLHVWLPDAMEGPTPVSALMHAATMVAAGVYMLCRVSFLILPDAESWMQAAPTIIAWIGGITAIMAAMIAIAQNDIKRILAYSTLSQLGYMVMAVGLGGPNQATFHLTTHAFFKALLFLGAGSVIHALHHQQDIWKMGGMWKKAPITFATFIIGTLALAGVWPLSGFYSKDEILLLAFDHSKPLFIIAVLTAFMTAFYMGREVFVVFFGKPRDHHAYDHAHESPLLMTLPLVFLAGLSIIAGWGNRLPEFIAGEMEHAGHHPAMLTAGLTILPFIGFALAAKIYGKAQPSDAPVKAALGPAYTWMENKFYFDELYAWIVKNVQGTIATTCELFDRWVLQKIGIGTLSMGTGLSGRFLRMIQTGNIQSYAFFFGLGVTVIIYYVVVR